MISKLATVGNVRAVMEFAGSVRREQEISKTLVWPEACFGDGRSRVRADRRETLHAIQKCDFNHARRLV